MTGKRRPWKKFLTSLFLLLCWCIGSNAQDQLLNTRISVDLGAGSLVSGVLQVQEASGISFAYEAGTLSAYTVQARSFKNERLDHILQYLLAGTQCRFEEKYNAIVIGPAAANEKKWYRFSGIIEDKETGKALEGVALYATADRHIGTHTNRLGRFDLWARQDTLRLRMSYLSYKPADIVLQAADSSLSRISMSMAPEGLDSVLVCAPGDFSREPFPSILIRDRKEIAFLPRFCGDVDLAGVLKTMAGIGEANDGSGALTVRGGAPDQNLLLLDGINIYNSVHLFGLLSSVNATAVKDMKVYKSDFPARYGGRISSVWDITLKDGDLQQWHGSGSLGTLSSDFMLQGPIIRDKTSFMIAARRSYHDYYMRLFDPGLVFYSQDLNVKLRHRFSDKDQLTFTYYRSFDRFRKDHDTTRSVLEPTEYMLIEDNNMRLDNRNTAAGLSWRHRSDNGLTLKAGLQYSSYKLHTENTTDISVEGLLGGLSMTDHSDNGLQDMGAKLDVSYAAGDKHLLEAGLYYTRHSFDTNVNTFRLQDQFTGDLIYNERVVPALHSIEAGGYISDKLTLLSGLEASAGLHFSHFANGDARYFSLQPRVDLHYPIGKWAVNAAYVRMQQNLHRLTISQTSLPLDFWIPSTTVIKPQVSDQVSLGLYGRPLERYSFSLETYYKPMRQVAEYLLVNTRPSEDWDNEVATGKGKAYGLEMTMRKTAGALSGWVSYTLAWSRRLLPEVNNGLTFPYKYERRHNLCLVALYKPFKEWEFSAVFTYQSKPPAPVLLIRTEDMSFVQAYGILLPTEQIMKAYHRLDLGISWIKTKKRFTRTLNLSVFNVYNRDNFFYYLQVGSMGIQGKKMNTLPIAASLSCTLSF